jgi:hypothetical protein
MEEDLMHTRALSRHLLSMLLLVLLVLAGASALAATVQQTQSHPNPLTQPMPISLPHLYWHFLLHQKDLDNMAAQLQAKGRDGNPLRRDLQARLGFSDADFAFIRSASRKLASKLGPINAQLRAPVHTPGNASEAKVPVAQREAYIENEVYNLSHELLPQNKATLEAFMAQFFAFRPLTFRVPAAARTQSTGLYVDECSAGDANFYVGGADFQNGSAMDSYGHDGADFHDDSAADFYVRGAVEEIACIYGDASQLIGYAETQLTDWTYSGMVIGQASEVQIYDGKSLKADSGNPDCPSGSSCVDSYSSYAFVNLSPVEVGDAFIFVSSIWGLYNPLWEDSQNAPYWIRASDCGAGEGDDRPSETPTETSAGAPFPAAFFLRPGPRYGYAFSRHVEGNRSFERMSFEACGQPLRGSHLSGDGSGEPGACVAACHAHLCRPSQTSQASRI